MTLLTSASGTKIVRISNNNGQINAAYCQISNTGIGKSEDLLQLKEFKSEKSAIKWGNKILA